MKLLMKLIFAILDVSLTMGLTRCYFMYLPLMSIDITSDMENFIHIVSVKLKLQVSELKSVILHLNHRFINSYCNYI